jgi:flavin reductase (DIM6/NTAB) family NADH-FMN oxidoreductase RutF
MEYAPELGHGLAYDPFKSLTVPRPIGWVSTISPEGVVNLAPYSQWQNLTWDPPMVMLAANQSVHGGRKDTVRNAEETGWFVWNMATWDLREAVAASARAVPPGTDEFELTGVTPEECALAPGPRVKESPCHLECRYVQTVRIPAATTVATVDLVIGRVEHVHIADEMLTDDGRVDIRRIRPLARLGYYDYTTVDHVFEMVTPGADEAELAGLEGTSIVKG